MSQKVCYMYSDEIGRFYYAKDHPMKPRRITMTHSLVESFNLYQMLDVYRGRQATREELLQFHHPEYLGYLENYVSKSVVGDSFMRTNDVMLQLQPQSEAEHRQELTQRQLKTQFCMNEAGDCPPFYGLYEFCQLSCGSSIDAANLLVAGKGDICINWGGGLHHAKKCEASGFCYTNDIVLSILELLKWHERVLYLDIDVHHGDGVQEAFFLTNRVMTLSFHQYGDGFFPGTGDISCVGEGIGRYYSLNIPLREGMDDDTYYDLFCYVLDLVIAKFKPGAIVLQLGTDSLAYDLLGRFNLSVKGHGRCVKKMMSYGLPLMMLGGGGYTVHNVARCWAYETGIALNQELEGMIPKTDRFYDSYLPDAKLHFGVKNVKNKNTDDYIHSLKEKVTEHMRMLQIAPGIPLHHIPTLIEQQDPECLHKRGTL